MHLFRSELLREPPRPAAPSYARHAYGARYGRRSPALGAVESARPGTVAGGLEDAPVAPAPRPSCTAVPTHPPFDRAA